MKRLLCIVSCMNTGGAETFLMKVYRNLDRKKYQMDFCVSADKEGFYDKEIKELGGMIFHVPMKSKNPIKAFKSIKKVVKDNNYEMVLRTSQQSLAALDLLAAKCGGAKKLIYRSSNAGLTGGFISRFINRLFAFLPRIVPNIKIAPSTEAAEFVFGNNSVKKGKVIVLPNGLDYDKFKFNNEIRMKIRKELKINNDITLYGHVGRFNVQKNHLFLLNVFNEIHKKDKKTLLILIGNGELEENIKKKIKDYRLDDSVKLLGIKNNVNEYLMAMDMMIFPSLFEGMPNVIIEAQATGLRCVISDKITKEANITNLVKYVSLDKSAIDWCNEVLEWNEYNRKDTHDLFKKEGYLIKDVVKKVETIMDGKGGDSL